jgi:lysophospholipase L1-like esterase
MITLVLISVGAIVVAGGNLLWRNLKNDVVAYYVANLSEQQKQALYREVAGMTSTLWDATPEPQVAVLGRRNHETADKGAEVRLNNAGFRSSVPFEPKDPERFRIVCLGDSFVFGSGGPEQDRFCNQLEDFYATRGIAVDGRSIETYALGLDGWTAVQESAYLSARLSAYEPDVIVLLSIGNDFTSIFGVTGTGALTGAFSPEYRQWGSGVFWHKAAQSFGWAPRSALVTDLGPEGRAVWEKGMLAIAGLVQKQHGRDGKILLSFMQQAPSYEGELYRLYLQELAVPAPYITTGYFPKQGNRLPHDSHPNRSGHAIIAHQFVHALSRLGWVPVPEDHLPPLHDGLSLDLETNSDEANLARQRKVFVNRHLRRALRFCCLEPEEAAALLGGVLLDRSVSERDTPWASVRSGFLMRRKADEKEFLELVIDVPARMELFPFRLDVHLDGALQTTLELTDVSDAGPHAIRAALPDNDDNDVIEVVLIAGSYFADIEDGRMKSFGLVSATISAE